MSAIFKCLRLLIHKAATAMLFFSPILPGFPQPMLPQIGCWLGWNKDSIADAGWQMLGVVMVFSERKDPRQTLFCRKTHSIVAIYFLKGFRGAFNKSHPALESFQQKSACLLESFQRACFWRKTTNFYAIVKSYGFRREKKTNTRSTKGLRVSVALAETQSTPARLRRPVFFLTGIVLYELLTGTLPYCHISDKDQVRVGICCICCIC